MANQPMEPRTVGVWVLIMLALILLWGVVTRLVWRVWQR